MKNKEKIAANVVTYNRKDLLRECLNSLLAQTRKPDSIIIIDNNSTDGTKEMVEKEFLKNPIFDYVRLNENTGSAGGQYTGIKRAYEKGFDWVWCMDDDTIAEKNSLEELLRANRKLSKKEKIGFLSSNVRWTDGSQAIMNLPKLAKNWGNNNNNLESGYIKIVQGSFVSILINKNTVKSVGYPIKEFFIWLDDVEYSRRISSFGYSNYLIISSKVIHKTKENMGTNIKNINDSNKIKYRYLFKNQTYLLKQSKGDEKIKSLINLIYEGIRLLFSKKVKFFFIIFLPSFISGLFFTPKSAKEILP